MQFQQITQAWKTLSNPLERKRYDRDLRAQKFTQDVEQALGNWANTAGPQFLRAFENVAIPFLRRSAATTVAGWNAVAQDVQMYSMNRKARERQQQQQQQQQQESSSSSSSSPPPRMGLGAILSNALVATQKAGKAIDRLELIEKSRELSKRAQKEMRDAAKLREELDEIARKRVQLTLHTPKSNLTSLEAMIILDGFNTVDEVTMMDTVLMRRKTVTFEIERLEEIENQVKEKRDRNQEIACKIQEQKSSLEQAKINESVALTAVENARKALQDAMDLAQSARDSIIVMENNLQSYEEEQRINTMDMDKLNDAMMKQQERMRLALRRKEEAMATENNKARHDVQLDNHNNNNINNNIRGDFKDDIAEYAQAQVEKMLKQESFLRAESARLQAQAERLESRSVKLLERANELEEEEERAYKALEEGIRVAKQAADGGYGEYSMDGWMD
jgi:curved DNA-binding protein CbpA